MQIQSTCSLTFHEQHAILNVVSTTRHSTEIAFYNGIACKESEKYVFVVSTISAGFTKSCRRNSIKCSSRINTIATRWRRKYERDGGAAIGRIGHRRHHSQRYLERYPVTLPHARMENSRSDLCKEMLEGHLWQCAFV